MCYGNKYDDSISENTLSEYLGLSGYPGFKDRIEELVVYSSVKGNYCELAAIKLYRASDIPDAKLFFERRIKAVTRATNMSNIKSYTENAFIKTYGNVIVLYMMPDNDATKKKIEKKI